MNISEKDRAFLLGTDSFMVQIQRILKQWPDMTMQLAELRSFYPDLSEGRFRSTVYSMQAKGIVKIEDNLISLLKESKVNGEVASKVWKAMKMKGCFTLREIVEILPDILPSSIRGFITKWEQMGALTRIIAIDGEDCVWSVDQKRKQRPKFKCSKPVRKPKESATGLIVAKVLEVLDTYDEKPFTPSKLFQDLGEDIGSNSFVQHLLTSWQKMGLIKLKSYDGEEYVYKVNRTLVNKIGWGDGKWKKE